MKQQSEAQILKSIASGLPFSTCLEDGSVILEVKEYKPFICTAIHDGHNMPPEVAGDCLLSDAERLQEEDPCTLEFILDLPITIAGGDSRYAYDLNRKPENPTYEIAWGKQVWKQPLSEEQRQSMIARHDRYYRILHALIEKTIEIAGNCFVVDLHSYCHKIRSYPFAPVFNTGTFQIEMTRWKSLVSAFERELQKISIPGVHTTVGRDVVFQGRAWQAGYIKQHFPHVPVLPTEVKKVYMDELSGTMNKKRIKAIRDGIKTAVLNTAAFFEQIKATAERIS